MPGTALYIGATMRAAGDASTYMGPVRVPRSMSKATTINAHIAEVNQQRQNDAAAPPQAYADSTLAGDRRYENRIQRPGLAMLTSVIILDRNGNQVYAQETTGPQLRGKVAVPLLSYLKEAYPHQFSDNLRYSDGTPDAAIFGFNIKQVLRIAAFEVLKRNQSEDTKIQVPVRMWHNPIGCYDPYDVLLPSPDQKDLDIFSLMRYFGIAEASPEELATSALLQAQVARELVLAAQLLPLGS